MNIGIQDRRVYGSMLKGYTHLTPFSDSHVELMFATLFSPLIIKNNLLFLYLLIFLQSHFYQLSLNWLIK